MCENTSFMEYRRMIVLTDILKNYSEKFWKISKKTPLKRSGFNNDGDSRPLNLLKTQSYSVKIMTFVAYMLNINSLTGIPHSPNFEKIASYVANPAEFFYLCPRLYFFLFGFNYWIQHYKLFCFKKGTISRALSNI